MIPIGKGEKIHGCWVFGGGRDKQVEYEDSFACETILYDTVMLTEDSPV